MKAITLHQPWATLIAAGHKTVETRSWPTNHRGPICIHAGRKSAADGIDALEKAGVRLDCLYDAPLPLGAIIAIADVWDCKRMDAEWVESLSPLERAVGDHKPDRYGWILRNVEPIEPVAARGAQGIWEVPGDVAQSVMNQTFNVGWS